MTRPSLVRETFTDRFGQIALVGLLTTALVFAAEGPAAAAPPSVPAVVTPTANSTVTGPDIPLQVTTGDPDGGPVTVDFYGRTVGATQPAPTTADDFTIGVLPDTQNYTWNDSFPTMTAQTQWYTDNRAALKLAFVSHLGDMVSEYDIDVQWQRFSAAMSVFDTNAVPYSVVPGNHDFDETTGTATLLNSYFPPSRFSGASWNSPTAQFGGYLGQNLFGPDPIDSGMKDSFSLVTAGGRDLLILSLEFEPTAAAVTWARAVLAAYPNRMVIVVTHNFLNVNGNRPTTAERGPTGTSPQALWTQFIAPNCQIRLVLSGHAWVGGTGEARRSDDNSCGQPVQQVMSDYQGRQNGGDGWLRYYTFRPSTNTVDAYTYSPTRNEYETDADSRFTLPFPLAPTVPAPFTLIGSQTVAAGSTASTTWNGRSSGQSYEWYAIARDGTDSATSATSTFQVAASQALATDTFTRTVAGAWGTSDSGHAWTTTGGAANVAVGPTTGRLVAAAGTTRTAALSGLSAVDSSMLASFAIDKVATGSGTYVALQNRTVGSSSYRAKLRYLADGTLALSLIRYTGSEVTLANSAPGISVAAGEQLSVRFEAVGTAPTVLRARVWRTGAAEPSTWLVTANDTTAALQASGTFGINHYVSGTATQVPVTLAVDALQVNRIGTVTPPPPIPNMPPTAIIPTPSISERTVGLSSAGSTDSDGTITGFSWNFGDGSPTASGPTASHTYPLDGTYLVTLTATDDDGAIGQQTRSVTVVATPPPPANTPPTAVIGTPTISERTVGLSGSGSTDGDGAITGYSWNFGDGSPADTGVSTSHTYAADGTYTVTLTVTDDDGATAQDTRSVQVSSTPPANTPPTAVIGTPTISERTVGLSGTSSTDGDGTVTGYSWNFGDGTPAETGPTATHTYGSDGTYTVTLTVTDDDGATAQDTRSVQVAATPPPPVNAAPTAVIGTPTISGRTVGLSGAGSTDGDGTITGYLWAFGDGTPTATGATPSHTYAADGTYVVTLTVTDDDGATGMTTRSVAVTAPPPAGPLVADTFTRTVTNGWGTADTGGAWTVTGTAANYRVATGRGVLTMPTLGGTAETYLGSFSATSVQIRSDITIDKAATGGALYASVVARRVGTTGDYRAKVVVQTNGRLQLQLVRRSAGTETALVWVDLPATLLHTAGSTYTIVVQASGTAPTQLRAKLWRTGQAEPAAWQLSTSDATAALQTAGSLGFLNYVSRSSTAAPITLSIDNLTVTPGVG